MATEIRVPTLGESVSEATIGKWFKKPGEAVKAYHADLDKQGVAPLRSLAADNEITEAVLRHG